MGWPDVRGAPERRALAAAVVASACLGATTARAQSTEHVEAHAPPAAVAPLVLVHIDTPAPVDLETQMPGEGWQKVCSSPCDKALPAEHYYRISGDGVRPSAPVTLGPGQRVSMQVDPGSSGGHAVGVTLVVVGIIGLAPGLGVTAAIVGGEIAGAILICPIAIVFVSKAKQNSEYGNCLGDIATFLAKGYVSPYVWGPAIVGGVATTAGVIVLTQQHGTNVNQIPQAMAAPRNEWAQAGEGAPGLGADIRYPEPMLFRPVDIKF